MDTLIGTAHAKINLFLAVTGVREDGYHTLQTIFQEITLGDNLSLSRHRGGGISLRSNLHYLPRDEKNLAYRAAVLFFETSGIHNTGLYINIKKNIPVGAGMAGGSTNAAGVLDILNRMYGKPFSHAELKTLGLTLGADVPFCLEGGTVLAEGVGEEMRTLPPMPACWLVVCRPGISVSTKAAFELLDQCPQTVPPSAGGMLAALEQGSLEALCSNLYNVFEGPLFGQHPKIRQVKESLLQQGAEGALMTGTGSAVFGVFTAQDRAEAARARLRREHRDVFVVRPV